MSFLNREVCKSCVMDTTDSLIVFDSEGICNHCKRASKLLNQVQQNLNSRPFDLVMHEIRQLNSSSKFDGIIGLSGGVDSSYVAMKVVQAGLRPLVVHVDGGWNSETAVRNIRSLVELFDLPLVTKVINWNEMRDLQVAYLKSGIANQDVPQDHAFFSTLYKVAAEHRIKTVITGSNVSTESILPTSWEYDAMDGRHLKSIATAFSAELNTYPVLTSPRYYAEHMLLRRMKVFRPLNHLSYVRSEAVLELEKAVGWHDYGGKHRESLFTDWFQHSYLPHRLGIDKRKAHLSSLIASNQMTRDAALLELSQAPMTVHEEKRLSEFICRKLNISMGQLNQWILQPETPYTSFKNDEKLIANLAKLRFISKLRKIVGA